MGKKSGRDKYGPGIHSSNYRKGRRRKLRKAMGGLSWPQCEKRALNTLYSLGMFVYGTHYRMCVRASLRKVLSSVENNPMWTFESDQKALRLARGLLNNSQIGGEA